MQLLVLQSYILCKQRVHFVFFSLFQDVILLGLSLIRVVIGAVVADHGIHKILVRNVGEGREPAKAGGIGQEERGEKQSS